MNNWKEINLLARAYLELQRSRVGFVHRVLKLEDSELLRIGLLKEVTTTIKGRRSTKYEPLDKEQITLDKIAAMRKHIAETSRIHQILTAHKIRIQEQEKQMVKDAIGIFETMLVWQWCLIVKGLGPVAGLTLTGYINPERTPTFSNCASMFGITPGSKLVRGQQAKFVPLLRARLFVLATNVMKQKDPYYYAIYRIKKDYLSRRPDLVAKKDNKKGWKATIHRMALRSLMKMILSHAYELIITEYRATEWSDNKKYVYAKNYRRHGPELPPKQKEMNPRILEEFEEFLNSQLQELEKLWNDPTDTDHERYFRFLKAETKEKGDDPEDKEL